MGRKLKKLGVTLLLLIAKSFVYLRSLLQGVRIPFLGRLLQTIGGPLLYAALWLLTPLYRQYRFLKRALNQVYVAGHSRLLKSLSHRYALHGFLLLIAAVTVISNLSAKQAGAENFGTGSLVSSLVETDEELLLEEPALPVDFGASPTKAPSTEKKEESLARTFLSYTGETIFQPYLPTTEDSVAPRQSIEEYIVQAGDTPAAIAVKFRLQLNTLLLANNLSARSIIRPGQKLIILPVDGLLHTVKKGDNIGSIAKRYQVTPEAVLSFNRLPNAKSVLPGQTLVIPGGKPVPVAPPRRALANVPPNAPTINTGTKLLWPGGGRRITQYFTWRHSGIDIGLPKGSPVYAAEDGVVLESRWGGGYGNMVLIRHDNGLVTRYGHNSRNLVVPGQRVTRGQTIALVGSTGRSTGPHIHFEVITGGRRVNPLTYTR
jgi:LysM repeat protein